MDNRLLPRNKKLKVQAANLRNVATRQENHLWYDCLRTYSARFNRQRIIGVYIADFYCAKAKLVIELDGSQHYEEREMEHDKERTQYLEGLGIKVLRFSNMDVDVNFEGVCQIIDITVKDRM